MVMQHECRKRRPLFNMETKFENLPREWLKYVEPNILRGAFLPCWVWDGKTDKNGYPIMNYTDPLTKKFAVRYMRRFVCGIFWDLPTDWYVQMKCETINCLNPHHMHPTPFHPSHYINQK